MRAPDENRGGATELTPPPSPLFRARRSFVLRSSTSFPRFRSSLSILTNRLLRRREIDTRYTMHPPLDRPHPDCQEAVDALRECHQTTSKLQFWACNELKYNMDRCLKVEKEKMLKDMNKDFEAKRQREEDAFRDAIGQELTFDEYLKKDKGFQDASAEASERKKKNPHMFRRKAHGT